MAEVQQTEPITQKTDILKYKQTIENKWIAELPKNYAVIASEKLFLTASYFSITQTLLKEIGMFDERLSDTEDLDLAMRLADVGVPIWYQPKCVAWHDDRITCRSYIKRQRQYRAANQHLREIQPELSEKASAHYPIH